MSVSTPSPAPAAEQTEAGNYFVSNYPPFSFWLAEHLPALQDVLNSPALADIPLGLYFHIPFCRKRCHFCYFRVYTDKNAREIRAYIDAGMRELAMLAARPYLQGRSARFVYFGGGTPSYLSGPQLRELTQRMRDLISWDGVEEVAFEAEPGTLNEKKLETIREIGVTRLSLGVENFDDHVLESNGRAHRSGEVQRAFQVARELGFAHINIDLIAGMMNETEDNWQDCIRKTIDLAPDAVTIYQMEIPYNTTIYQQMKQQGKVTAPVADWPTKRRWVSEAFDALQAVGYTVTSAYTAVKDPARNRFVYRDELWEGADLLASGVASFGHLGGVHYQNQADVGPYMQAVDAGKLPVFRAYPTNAEERFIREFILKLKLGHFRASYYAEKFGEQVQTRFEAEFAEMIRRGFLLQTGADDFALTRAGLLQADRLCHEFFLPQHRKYERYT